MAYKKYSDSFKEKIIKELKNGVNYESISQKYSVNKQTITSWVLKNKESINMNKSKDEINRLQCLLERKNIEIEILENMLMKNLKK